MPTVEIDVTKQYESLYDSLVKQANYSGDLNPGQIATLNNVTPDITATAEVYIAGTDVEVTIELDVDFGNPPEYISETIETIYQTFELYSDKLESGRGYDSSSLIKEAFANL